MIVGTNQTVTTPRFHRIDSGLSDFSFYRGVTAIADYDNDGHVDMTAIRYDFDGEILILLHGDGGGHFTPITNSVFPTLNYFSTVEWVDYDNDGRLDLWVSGQYTTNINGRDVDLDYARLFHNLGQGQFAEELNFIPPQIDLNVAWGD